MHHSDHDKNSGACDERFKLLVYSTSPDQAPFVEEWFTKQAKKIEMSKCITGSL